nr:MAG TPA_asm: hypothetical protein [Caudoviricetes sp.]
MTTPGKECYLDNNLWREDIRWISEIRACRKRCRS